VRVSDADGRVGRLCDCVYCRLDDKSRLGWFGRVGQKGDNDWVKRCTTWEVEGIRQRGRPKKTWWDCVKNVLESLGLSQKDAQFRNKGRGELRGGGELANPGLS